MKHRRKLYTLLITWGCIATPLLILAMIRSRSLIQTDRTSNMISFNEIFIFAATIFILIPLQLWIIKCAHKANIKALKIIFIILTVHFVCFTILLLIAVIFVAKVQNGHIIF